MCRKSFLGISLLAFMLLVIAGAGLLQCWSLNIFRIMVDRDIICITDILMILETQYFDIGRRE